MLKQVVERAKLRGHWYLHKFRKPFATRALENADIRTVQALLGHKNITTAARYLSVNRQDATSGHETLAGRSKRSE